jgi:hypothetical protein
MSPELAHNRIKVMRRFVRSRQKLTAHPMTHPWSTDRNLLRPQAKSESVGIGRRSGWPNIKAKGLVARLHLSLKLKLPTATPFYFGCPL